MTDLVMIQPHASVAAMIPAHNLRNERFVHTNLEARSCACQGITFVRPQQTGEMCSSCGGMMVRTGTCTTCTECGNTGGCG